MHIRIASIAAALCLTAASASAQLKQERRIEQLRPPVIIQTAGQPLTVFTIRAVSAQTVALSDAHGVAWKHYPVSTAVQAAPSVSNHIVIADPDNEIAAIHTADGRRLRHILIPEAAQAVVPFLNGFILFGGDGERFAVALDSAGAETRAVALPRSITEMGRMGRGPITAATTDAWAVGLRYTGQILIQRVGEPAPREVVVVESRPSLPDTLFGGEDNMAVRKRNARSVATLRGLTWSGDLLYALAGGTGETAGRYVDVYDGRTLSYLRSYLLPREPVSIGVNAQGIVTLEAGGEGKLSFHPFR